MLCTSGRLGLACLNFTVLVSGVAPSAALGPGLGVRCLGAITRDRLEAVRESDAILREEFQIAGLDKVRRIFQQVFCYRLNDTSINTDQFFTSHTRFKYNTDTVKRNVTLSEAWIY